MFKYLILFFVICLGFNFSLWAQKNSGSNNSSVASEKAVEKVIDSTTLPDNTPNPSADFVSPVDKIETEKSATKTDAKPSLKDQVDQAADKAKNKVDEAVAKTVQTWKQTLGGSRDHRSTTSYGVLGSFSIFEMWVLTKYGITLQYIPSPEWTWELEYMTGSIGFSSFGIDIGKISEKRISILARSFSQRNSFNFIMGGYHNKFDVHLGDDLLSSVSGVSHSSVNVLETETIGLTWGLGNRWQLKNGTTLGVDWFVINIPISHTDGKSDFLRATSDPDDRRKVKDALNVLNKVPAIGALKIQAGWNF